MVDLDNLVSLHQLASLLGQAARDESRDEDPGSVPPSHQAQSQTLPGPLTQRDAQVLVEDRLRAGGLGPPLEADGDLVLGGPQLVQGLAVTQLGEVHGVHFGQTVARLQQVGFLCRTASVDLVDEDSDLKREKLS